LLIYKKKDIKIWILVKRKIIIMQEDICPFYISGVFF